MTELGPGSQGELQREGPSLGRDNLLNKEVGSSRVFKENACLQAMQKAFDG